MEPLAHHPREERDDGRSHRLRWRILVGASLGLFILLLVGFCVGSPQYYMDKYSSAPAIGILSPVPGEFVPEEQVEPHTCGLHSLRSIYRAYELDPDAANLRFRLGTDKRLTNFDAESVGTIHPDILRVLGQDGFGATLASAMHDGSRQVIREHLERGCPVMALVQVGTLHWLVLSTMKDEANVVIVDSLEPEPYVEPLDEYLDERVLSAILISPSRR